MQMQPVTSVVEVTPPMEPLETVGEDGVSSTWQPDPNEPRYCLCNDVSYGDMVGCDNEDVSEFVLSLSFTLRCRVIYYTIERLRERTEYIDIFLFSAHHSIMFCFRCSVYW